MKRVLVPARRRILHLAEGIARPYLSRAGEGLDMRMLCGDLWLAIEMQSLTPELGMRARAQLPGRSSVRGAGRRVQDIRPVSIPIRLDREFAKLARDHGLAPSVAIGFLMGWRAQHRRQPAV